jgi:hypothetical protein
MEISEWMAVVIVVSFVLGQIGGAHLLDWTLPESDNELAVSSTNQKSKVRKTATKFFA